MWKNGLIAILTVTLLISLAVLVRVENERYALQIGMCRDQATGLVNHSCITSVQTRTSALWHLFYAFKN